MAQSNATEAAPATACFDAEALVDSAFAAVRPQLVALVQSLTRLSPLAVFQFEVALFILLLEFGRVLLENLFNSHEGDGSLLPHDVIHLGQGYRRLGKKTRRQHVATLFGKICLWRFPYRIWERHASESCIFPLELQMGLIEGVTPALADWIGRGMAEAGATQRRLLFRLREEHGVCMGVGKLRKLLAALAEGLAEYQQPAQVASLLQALRTAFSSRGNRKPVLAVGRDGITMREYKHCFWEVATAATITVFDRAGKRLTTVYLAWRPELGQATMSEMLLSLLTEVLGQWDGPLPRLAYVTDSGDNETTFYLDRLRQMLHPRTGRPLQWVRVVDYYHAAQRIWQIAEALFGKNNKRYHKWARRMLRVLKKPNGPKRVLHSAATMRNRQRLGKKRLAAFNTAYNYIRSRTQWMQYANYRALNIPIGSGITEAACKTLFTQRLKLSGMRWTSEGATWILALRTTLLSKIWKATYNLTLASHEKLIPQPYVPSTTKSRIKAA